MKIYYYTNLAIAPMTFADKSMITVQELAQYRILKAPSAGLAQNYSALSNIAIRELTLSAAADRFQRKVTLEVQESDTSYRYRSLMSKPQLVLKFSLPTYVEIPVGAWCEYQGETYSLNTPQNIKKNGTRNIEYTLNMGAAQDNMSLYKLRNSVDRRLKFGMTAKPHEFIEEIVKNMNERDGTSKWKVGTCIEADEKTIEFNHTYIDAALSQVAETFETEWEIVGTTIHLHKVEYYKDDPLALSYGKGNGFMPGVGRNTPSNELPIKRLYVQGGDRNIDRSKYGSQYLLLPKSQTLEYEGRTYKSDADGYYIERVDKVSDAVKEDSLDCSERYPSRVGTVTSVIAVKPEKNFYDFIDNTIPADLDFNDYVIEGETATIIFQSGMLAGKEFEFKYKHAQRRFELVPQEIDGQTMPNATYKPNADGSKPDTYAIFGIMLPDSYICDNETKDGASWDMFRDAAKHLYENEDQKFTFQGTLQSLYAKRNWVNIGGKLIVGGYVHFSDEQFAKDGVDIRITGIKDYLTSPYSPTVEISNSVTGQSLSSKLREIDAQEIIIEDNHKDALQFTKRRFRDAQETLTMLEGALDNYSESVNPITVQTMAALIGDESLQFQFVKSLTSDAIDTSFQVTYNAETKQLSVPHSFLRHMTLGINSIKSSHSTSEYKTWEMNAYVSARLDDGDKKYYLYAKVSTDTSVKGDFLLSEKAIDLEAVSGYYHLLVGVLNSEYDEQRSYVSLYGFTEVLPGRITTDRIVSADGLNFLDLANNAFHIGNANTYLDWNNYVAAALSLKNVTIQNINSDGTIMFKIDGTDGSGRLAGGNIEWDDKGNTTIIGTIKAGKTKIITISSDVDNSGYGFIQLADAIKLEYADSFTYYDIWDRAQTSYNAGRITISSDNDGKTTIQGGLVDMQQLNCKRITNNGYAFLWGTIGLFGSILQNVTTINEGQEYTLSNSNNCYINNGTLILPHAAEGHMGQVIYVKGGTLKCANGNANIEHDGNNYSQYNLGGAPAILVGMYGWVLFKGW